MSRVSARVLNSRLYASGMYAPLVDPPMVMPPDFKLDPPRTMSVCSCTAIALELNELA